VKFLVKTKLSENISVTSEGFLLCKNVPLTHTGALKYQPGEHPFGDNVGEITIRRSPEELFSPVTMASFEGKDVTVQHPEEFVSPENYQDLTHGVLVNLRKGEKTIEVEGEQVEVLLGDLLIKSAEAIELVQSGEREVSLGYEAEWELEEGKTEGTHAKIKGNHCAIVSSGRAGIHCAITDSKENRMNIEKFKKLFGKTVDEAVAEKEKEEEKKAKDAEEAAEKEKKDKEASDAEKLDKVCADVAKLGEAINSLMEKLAPKKDGEDEEKDDESKDDDVIVEEDEESDDEESSDEGIEGEDSDEEESDKKKDKAGDTASRAEILCPGIDVKDKDVMVKALTAASKTTDGNKVIKTLIGDKDISKLPKEAIKPIFNAAAEMMKAKRVKDLSSTKAVTIDSFPSLKVGAMTAEQINKQNAEFYGKKK
jgi:hypothetical protein